MFRLAVVVAGDRAGADVDLLADRRVAQIREVIGLGPAAEPRLLELDEIPDASVGFDLRPGPDVRERSDRRPRADGRVRDDRVIENRHAVADRRVRQADVGVQPAAGANRRPPLKCRSRTDDRIRADRDAVVDGRAGRIFEGRSSQHDGAVLPGTHHCRDLGEIHAGVHAPQFRGVVEQKGFHPCFVPSIHADEVGQVVLALRVVSGQLVQRPEQRRKRERIDAAVDLLDLPLVAGRIPLFDNPENLS